MQPTEQQIVRIKTYYDTIYTIEAEMTALEQAANILIAIDAVKYQKSALVLREEASRAHTDATTYYEKIEKLRGPNPKPGFLN